MSATSAKAHEYLVDEIGRRQALRDRIDELAIRMPRRFTRTSWMLLASVAIAIACVLAALSSLQAALSASRNPSSLARTILIDPKADRVQQLEAVSRLIDSSSLNIEALILAAASAESDISAAATAGLSRLHARLGK